MRVDLSHPGAVFPADFVGLSFEASILGSPLLDPARSNLPGLLRTLGAGRLRFGGNSLDRVAGNATPEELGRLGALAAATGWKIDLGVPALHPAPGAAATEVATAERLIGPGLGTIQVGNEPDDYPGADYARYRGVVDAYKRAVRGVTFSGPDTAAAAWLAAFARDERPAFLTQHFYPLTRCGGRRPGIADLLSPATRQREAALIDAAVAPGLPVRIDETNSASCGGQDGTSNTLASALWITDYLLLAGSRGVAGVGVQGGLGVCRGYTPLCVPGAAAVGFAPGIDAIADQSLGAASSGTVGVQPDYFGLLLVHALAGGRWVPVSAPAGLRAYATEMPDGSVRVVLDNFGPAVRVHAGISGRLVVRRLDGPGLAATAGVALRPAVATGRTVTVAAGSAILLSNQREGSV